MARIHTKLTGQDLCRGVSCEQQFVLFFLCVSPSTWHSLSRCQCSLYSARMTDSSSSALSRLKTFALAISQQIRISMTNHTQGWFRLDTRVASHGGMFAQRTPNQRTLRERVPMKRGLGPMLWSATGFGNVPSTRTPPPTKNRRRETCASPLPFHGDFVEFRRRVYQRE